MTHKLKTIQPYFGDVGAGFKKFEIRKNDRNFQVYDILILQEYDPKTKSLSGREIKAEITYLLSECPDFGLMDGYALLSIRVTSYNF